MLRPNALACWPAGVKHAPGQRAGALFLVQHLLLRPEDVPAVIVDRLQLEV